MAESHQASSHLTIDDVDQALKRTGPAERAFFRELLATDNPRQAMRFIECLHHFPGSKLEPLPHREGKPLQTVVNEMFPEMVDDDSR